MRRSRVSRVSEPVPALRGFLGSLSIAAHALLVPLKIKDPSEGLASLGPQRLVPAFRSVVQIDPLLLRIDEPASMHY